MAFQQGAASDIDDLFGDLDTFLTGPLGWTLDGSIGSSGFGFSKGNIFVQFRYDGTSPVGVGRHLALYQSLGYTGGGSVFPGDHPDDSGNGHAAGTGPPTDNSLDGERGCTDFGDGPFLNYWFFADTSPDYCYVVVEVRTGEYRHFGFGLLNKFGDDWTGGEFVYAQKQLANNAAAVNDTCLIDGLATDVSGGDRVDFHTATMHLEGLPQQDAASKWGNCLGNLADDGGTDRAGEARVLVYGTFRCGPVAQTFGGYGGSASTGLVPMTPIHAFYLEPSSGTRAMYLGSMPDIRQVNIRDFAPAEEVLISTDTWVVFPKSIRSLIEGGGAPARSSFVQGIAYLKVL